MNVPRLHHPIVLVHGVMGYGRLGSKGVESRSDAMSDRPPAHLFPPPPSRSLTAPALSSGARETRS